MDVITFPLYTPPLLLAGALVLVTLLGWVGLALKRGGLHRVDTAGAVLIVLTTAVVGGIILGAWTDVHNENLWKQGTAQFERTYQMSIIDGDLPVGPDQVVAPVSAHLHDEAGLQACLVEVTPQATYSVICNGSEIHPVVD